jgi:spore germination protein
MEIYVVKQGDTAASIAANTGVPLSSILFNNQLTYPYRLTVGEALLISYDGDENRQVITTNGYAYPHINQDTLRQSLPYMSALSIFSYGFTTEGGLIPPKIDDTFLINLAKSYNSRPVLTLTPIDASGTFNNNLITVLVHNPEAIARLIEELGVQITSRGFEGVDIDFEYILPTDRVAFAEFVAAVRRSINALGFPVSVALAPKTSDNQKGLLYEGKDYALLGEAANSVLLMTYEWGYTYSVPMAVAPIDKVRQVVEYALTRIPAEKIDLGVPNYGYDWPLPYVSGTTRATSIGNLTARERAVENGVAIQFDETAKSPWYTYQKDGISHEVWFEDVRSYQAKFALVTEYGLRGIGFWQLMRPNLPGFLLMSGTFWIQ